MAPGQPSFDGILTLKQPVHGGVKIVLVDLPERQRLGEGVARGVRRKPRAVASFEPGSTMRATIIASTRRRSTTSPRRRSCGPGAVCAACRHGGDMAVRKGALDVNASSRPTSGSFLSTRRRASIFLRGPLGRLARVRFLTLPFSRQPSRKRMAGGELRLGTVSTYMGTMIVHECLQCNTIGSLYMGTHARHSDTLSPTE